MEYTITVDQDNEITIKWEGRQLITHLSCTSELYTLNVPSDIIDHLQKMGLLK